MTWRDALAHAAHKSRDLVDSRLRDQKKPECFASQIAIFEVIETIAAENLKAYFVLNPEWMAASVLRSCDKKLFWDGGP